MTATPIPRTLALTAYGDLDVSILDEKPPGRTPVTTLLGSASQRGEVLGLLRHEVAAGRQAYVVYPLVEESEKLEDAKAATRMAEEWRAALPGVAVGLLHGRMKSGEKEEAMAAFSRGETQVLVATTVVEVGVDVPNATVPLTVAVGDRAARANCRARPARHAVGLVEARTAAQLRRNAILSEGEPRERALLEAARADANGIVESVRQSVQVELAEARGALPADARALAREAAARILGRAL